ncbi:MAG: type pilus assembly protein PilM [Actinomycetia bacterium]|nr:type pilus assembly protein PilM [Actinomycetes bacterium]
MARRLIGLDIGTNAVRVAEIEPGDPPVLRAFGQVALPPDAMREGEVVDPAAVTAAITRLWKELGLKKGDVRIAIASPRVVVRLVDLPTMSDDDLRGALQFQAQELIPIPLADAVMDFQPLEAVPGPEGQQLTRILLAAAPAENVARLVGAVRAAGLRATAVDLVPLALVRSLGRNVLLGDEGAEAIVSVGAGVTVVVVHEGGVPRFVRVLGTGGRAFTDAITEALNIEPDAAEALKRQGSAAGDDFTPARQAMARPTDALLEDIRGSIDYYRTQSGATEIRQVVITGGGSQLEGLGPQLAQLTGVEVVEGRPRAGLTVGDIGFPREDLPNLDPYLAVPVGVALGGLAAGRRINLLPGGSARSRSDRPPGLVPAIIVAVFLLLGATALTYFHQKDRDDAKKKAAAAEAVVATKQQQLAGLNDVQQARTDIQAVQTEVKGLYATDVSWAGLLGKVGQVTPQDVWLTSFTGTVSPPVAAAPVAPTATTAPGGTTTTAAVTTTTAAPVPTGLSGSMTVAAVGFDFPSVSQWLTNIGFDNGASIADPWVPSVAKGTLGTRSIVNFSSNAILGPGALSSRARAVLGADAAQVPTATTAPTATIAPTPGTGTTP